MNYKMVWQLNRHQNVGRQIKGWSPIKMNRGFQ